MNSPANIVLHTGATLLEACRAAKAANMFLISDGLDVKVSPIVPPGWREIPIKVKITAPDSGRVCTGERAAA